MEKCSKPHNIDMWVVLTPLSQLLLHILLCLRLSHIVSKLMWGVCPVICEEIVHMYRIPDQECQKAYGVFMIWYGLNLHFPGCLIELPAVSRDNLTCRAVDNFPPALRVIQSVYLQLLCMESFHQTDPECLSSRRLPVADQVFLLNLIRILFCPCIVFSGCVIGCITLDRF